MIVVVMMLLPCSIQGYIDVCCRVWTLLSCANLACPVLQGRCLVRLHIAQGMADVAFPPPQQATAVTADALSYVFCVCVCVQIGSFGGITPFQSLLKNRSDLWDVAAAGPLAGIAASTALLAIGLSQSHQGGLPQVKPDS